MPLKDPEANRAYWAAHYQKNKERVKARVAAYQAKNREAYLFRMRDWYEENKEQVSAETRAQRAEDPAPFREKERRQRERNIEHARSKARARYEKNREKYKARVDRYRRNNPDKKAMAQQIRRARKAGAVTEKFLRSEILERDGPLCAFCCVETTLPTYRKYNPTDRHYDHVVPLARGGAHTVENMRILCGHCNIRKKHKLDSEFLQKKGGD